VAQVVLDADEESADSLDCEYPRTGLANPEFLPVLHPGLRREEVIDLRTSRSQPTTIISGYQVGGPEGTERKGPIRLFLQIKARVIHQQAFRRHRLYLLVSTVGRIQETGVSPDRPDCVPMLVAHGQVTGPEQKKLFPREGHGRIRMEGA